MIVRTYRAWVRPGNEADYLALLHQFVAPAAESTPGLLAWHIGRRMDGPTPEFVIVTVWHDLASVEAVVGGDWHRPIFFDREEALIERYSVELYEGVGLPRE